METPPAPLISWDDPFTPAMAARSGISRAALDRLHRDGQVRRLIRGVYLDARVTATPQVRARAVALRVTRTQVIARRTAAWVYGAEPLGAGALVPIEVYGARSRWRSGPPLRAEEITEIEGVRCTAPVRTALDIARHLAPERALPLLDGLLRVGVLSHTELLAACSDLSEGSRQSNARIRDLAARADPRSGGEAESVLRLRWLESSLPTPTPGLVVAGIRLSLGARAQRFGAVLGDRVRVADIERCREAGWSVVTVPAELVLAGDAVLVAEHLEREFHQHLLSQLA